MKHGDISNPHRFLVFVDVIGPFIEARFKERLFGKWRRRTADAMSANLRGYVSGKSFRMAAMAHRFMQEMEESWVVGVVPSDYPIGWIRQALTHLTFGFSEYVRPEEVEQRVADSNVDAVLCLTNQDVTWSRRMRPQNVTQSRYQTPIDFFTSLQKFYRSQS